MLREAASPSGTTLSSHHASSSSSAVQSLHHSSLLSPYESFYAGHTHDSSVSSARDLQLSFMREEIDGLRMKNRVPETEVIVWKTRFESTQEAIKMFQDSAGSVMLLNNSSNSLPATKIIPPPLSQLLFTKVKFWTACDYDLECKKLAGETNGLAKHIKKRGRPSRADSDELDDDDKHRYLEDSSGRPISQELLTQVGHKARRLWQALKKQECAPTTWGKASEFAYSYYAGEMLNDTDFVFFQYCKNNWKLNRWTTKTYASWARNHIRTPSRPMKKPKHEILNNPTLLKMDNDSPSAPDKCTSPFPSTGFETASIPAEVRLATALPQERVEILDPLDNDDLYAPIKATNLATAPMATTAESATMTAASQALEGLSAQTAAAQIDDPSFGTHSSTPPTKSPHDGFIASTEVSASPTPPTTTPATETHERSDAQTAPTTSPVTSQSPNPKPTVYAPAKAKATKKAKLAVVGPGYTDKNWAMRAWLTTHHGGLKSDFEAYWKNIPIGEKAVFSQEAKIAKKAAK